MIKFVEKMLLFPVWIVLLMTGLAVKIMTDFFNITKGIAGIFLGFLLIGTLIWFRHDYMRYVIIFIAEGIISLILFAGVLVQVLIDEARKTIGNIIFC